MGPLRSDRGRVPLPPGMVAGAHRRNALVALGYLVVAYLLTRVGVAFQTLLGSV